MRLSISASMTFSSRTSLLQYFLGGKILCATPLRRSNQLDHHQMFNIVKLCPQSVATFWKSSCGFFTVGGPGPNSIRPRLRSKSAKDLVVQEPFAWSLLRGEFKKRHGTTIEQQRSALKKSTDRARRERND